MTIAEILELPKYEQVRNYMNELAAEYLRLSGRKVCRSCGGDVEFMLSYLKNKQIMSKFELKNHSAIYRVQKGSPKRISQTLLTDIKAIEYLSINKERIELFKSYPENWEKLVNDFLKVEEELPTKDEDCCEDETEVPCDDCMRKELNKLSMKELKEQYPEIPIDFAMKKAKLIEDIIQYKLAEAKK